MFDRLFAIQCSTCGAWLTTCEDGTSFCAGCMRPLGIGSTPSRPGRRIDWSRIQTLRDLVES